MTSKILIITGLGIGYYLFVKIPHKKVKYLPKKFAKRKQIIPKKTLSISTVTNKPITEVINISGAPSQIPKDILELERQNALAEVARIAGLAQEAARIEAATETGKARIAAKQEAFFARNAEIARQNSIAETARIAGLRQATARVQEAALPIEARRMAQEAALPAAARALAKTPVIRDITKEIDIIRGSINYWTTQGKTNIVNNLKIKLNLLLNR